MSKPKIMFVLDSSGCVFCDVDMPAQGGWHMLKSGPIKCTVALANAAKTGRRNSARNKSKIKNNKKRLSVGADGGI